MIALQDIRSLTDFQRNTKAHLKRLKSTGRPEALTVNGKAELIVHDAAAYEETLAAIHGIQQGLDAMKEGKGEPARKVLDRIRAKRKIPRSSQTKAHQAWVDEAMAGSFRPGSAARLRTIAGKARAVVA
jgi:PHD/YefM family antitoxin component YafN of YafNO toxin-antitoxin module